MARHNRGLCYAEETATEAANAPTLATHGGSVEIDPASPFAGKLIADAVSVVCVATGGSGARGCRIVPWQYFPGSGSGAWVPGKPQLLGEAAYNKANEVSGSMSVFLEAGATRFFAQVEEIFGSPTNVKITCYKDEREDHR